VICCIVRVRREKYFASLFDRSGIIDSDRSVPDKSKRSPDERQRYPGLRLGLTSVSRISLTLMRATAEWLALQNQIRFRRDHPPNPLAKYPRARNGGTMNKANRLHAEPIRV
jgi:hypothetical protein